MSTAKLSTGQYEGIIGTKLHFHAGPAPNSSGGGLRSHRSDAGDVPAAMIDDTVGSVGKSSGLLLLEDTSDGIDHCLRSVLGSVPDVAFAACTRGNHVYASALAHSQYVMRIWSLCDFKMSMSSYMRAGTGLATPSPVATGSPAAASEDRDASQSARQQAAASAVDDVAAEQLQDVAPPTFVLLATQQYLRLYSPELLRQGDKLDLNFLHDYAALLTGSISGEANSGAVACTYEFHLGHHTVVLLSASGAQT